VKIGSFAMVTDITERKQAEERLQPAKERAEEATRLKDQFVSIVAHDLRSPFASIMGLLSLLRSDLKGGLGEKQRGMLDTAISSGEQLRVMIDEMLDVSRLQTGKVRPEPRFIDASTVALSAIGSLAYIAHEKNVELVNNVPYGSRMLADPVLYGEVIQNLLSNAIKFSDKGGAVTVRIPDGNPTTLAVIDEGPGVKEEFLADLFKHEVKTTSPGPAGEQGTGLGLPYSHDIMTAHGGRLWLETEEGKGSVFYASLPYVRPRVLVAVGEDHARYMIGKILDSLDVSITVAATPSDACPTRTSRRHA